MTDLATSSTTARAVVDAMRARYAALRSYQDRGIVRVEVSSHELPLDLVFETHYEAPDRFRFAYEVPHPYPALRGRTTRYLVVGDGSEAWSQTTFPDAAAPELRRHRTLVQAVASATGMACGSAHTIARLLMPVRFGDFFGALQGLAVNGDCRIDEIECLRIGGTHPYAGAEEFCIGRHDSLLRKLSKRSANLPVTEMRGAIALDQPLPERVFDAPR